MKKLALTVAAIMLLPVAALAADPQSKSLTPQQQKMADCSHAAKGKTGADYKSAVSACMKGNGATAAPAKKTSQERMSACSKQNAGKKGADYKNAVSACMKAN